MHLYVREHVPFHELRERVSSHDLNKWHPIVNVSQSSFPFGSSSDMRSCQSFPERFIIIISIFMLTHCWVGPSPKSGSSCMCKGPRPKVTNLKGSKCMWRVSLADAVQLRWRRLASRLLFKLRRRLVASFAGAFRAYWRDRGRFG